MQKLANAEARAFEKTLCPVSDVTINEASKKAYCFIKRKHFCMLTNNFAGDIYVLWNEKSQRAYKKNIYQEQEFFECVSVFKEMKIRLVCSLKRSIADLVFHFIHSCTDYMRAILSGYNKKISTKIFAYSSL